MLINDAWRRTKTNYNTSPEWLNEYKNQISIIVKIQSKKNWHRSKLLRLRQDSEVVNRYEIWYDTLIIRYTGNSKTSSNLWFYMNWGCLGIAGVTNKKSFVSYFGLNPRDSAIQGHYFDIEVLNAFPVINYWFNITIKIKVLLNEE